MADDDRKNITPEAGEEYTHLKEQLRSLEDVLVSWKEERDKEEAKKEKRFQRFVVQLVVIFTGAVGVVWSGIEMGAWYLDRLQQEKMANNYVTVASEMYELENNPEVALQMLDKALELDDCFENRYQKAYISGMKAVQNLLNLDRPFTREELNTAHQSLAESKFLVQLSPKRAEGYILQSQIYIALKEYENAEKSIKKALSIAPEHIFAQIRYVTLLHSRKRNQEAYELIKKVVAAAPDNKWGRLWYGLILDARKQKKEALEEFAAAIKLDPKFDTAIYNLGCCYLNSRPRQFAQARKNFLRVLKINPAYKQAYYQLGMSYGYEDRYDVALTYMDKAIAISEDYLTAQNWRALVLFEMKRYSEAAEGYSKAIMLDPRNDELYVRRAAASGELKQFENAVNDLNFALELNPQNLEAVMTLSNIYLKTGNMDMALAKIDSALKAASDDKAFSADLWSLRAKTWVKKAQFDKAVQDQQMAVKCFRSKYTLYSLAFYQIKAKQNAEVVKTLDMLHKLDAKFAPGWKLRAIFFEKSNKAEAIAALDKYLALRPQDKKMQQMKSEIYKLLHIQSQRK